MPRDHDNGIQGQYSTSLGAVLQPAHRHSQRGKFAVGDSIEILQPDGSVVKLTPAWIENADGERVDATPHPMMQYTIPCETPLMAYSLIRMQKQ